MQSEQNTMQKKQYKYSKFVQNDTFAVIHLKRKIAEQFLHQNAMYVAYYSRAAQHEHTYEYTNKHFDMTTIVIALKLLNMMQIKSKCITRCMKHIKIATQ